MEKDSLLAIGLLKCIVDADGTEFRLAWLVERSGLTSREIGLASKRLEEWKAVGTVWDGRCLVSISVTDDTYRVYRQIFETPPVS